MWNFVNYLVSVVTVTQDVHVVTVAQDVHVVTVTQDVHVVSDARCACGDSDARCTRELKSRIVPAGAAFNKTHNHFYKQIRFKFKQWNPTSTFEALLSLALKNWTIGKANHGNLKVLKCGAAEGWGRSVGPIVWDMKKCYLESMSRGISYRKWKEERLTGLVTAGVGTAFWDTLLKEG